MSYPTALDNLSTLTGSESMTTHSSLHNEERDAIDALQAKVGVNSSAVATSLDYKVSNASSSNPGHKHTLAHGATDVTASAAELNYVDGVTSSIQTQLDAKAPIASPSFTGDVNLATGANIQVNSADPYRTIVIPAGSMSPTTTAGCASVATVEAGTNDVDYKVLDFDQTTEENAFVIFSMPDSWDGGTITAKFIWTTAASSGDVIWALKGRSFANDDAIDQAYGTSQTVTDTFIAAGDIHITSATSAITLAGSPAGGQLVQLKVYRDADAGGDTLNGDARLIAVQIEYKIAQYSD